MQYKKNPKSIRDVSKELNAGTILEGSVRKAGNRLRITAQMIDATRDRHLWAETYDRNLEDVFAVQSEVAERVADALQVRMHRAEHGESTADIEAYTMYLRAMQLYHEDAEKSYREAIALFEGTISKDPKFARAYAGLASAWCFMQHWEDFTASINKAEVAARKALELGPGSAEAHAAMAFVHGSMDRHEEERLELERAIRINPNLAEANLLLGWHCAVFGRFDEAIEYLRKACSLDPLAPRPAFVLTWVLRVTGKVDDALEVVGRLKELHLRSPMIYYATAMCYIQKKDFVRASEALDYGLRFNPNDRNLRTAWGTMYALMGKREEALDELRDLMKQEAESLRLDAQLWIRTALGDTDEAFEALMRGAETHAWEGLIKFDPLLEGLRKDPRFAEFCKKVGLPP
jgi:adenylate cyclase